MSESASEFSARRPPTSSTDPGRGGTTVTVGARRPQRKISRSKMSKMSESTDHCPNGQVQVSLVYGRRSLKFKFPRRRAARHCTIAWTVTTGVTVG